MLNKVTLMGRLARDPELKYTQSGKAFTKFSIAVTREFNRDEADFINCVIWRQQAENLANWAKKGALIGITGRIQTRNYENQQGQRVYVTEVIAESFQVLESRTAREGQGGGYAAGGQYTAGNSFGSSPQVPSATPNFAREESPFGGNPMDISDDDLPF